MKCECGKEILGSYFDRCEDCYADAQPPAMDRNRFLRRAEPVPAGMLDIEEVIDGGWAVI